jgi:hypothetical protein
MKHPLKFNKFIVMKPLIKSSAYLCEIRTGKMERGILQRGGRESPNHRLRERERERG